MSRDLRPGDIVTVTLGGSSSRFIVKRLDLPRIYIHPEGDSNTQNAIVNDNGWKVVGDEHTDYGVTFSENSSEGGLGLSQSSASYSKGPSELSSQEVIMTGVFDVDVTILNELDDISLSRVCQVDNYVRRLCNNSELWQRRLEKYLPGVNPYIDLNVSMKQNYENFSKYPQDSEGMRQALLDGNLIFSKWLRQHNPSIVLNEEHFYAALVSGDVASMDWITNEMSIGPDGVANYVKMNSPHFEGLDYWIRQIDQPAALQWLWDHGVDIHIDTYIHLEELVHQRSIKLLRYLRDQVINILKEDENLRAFTSNLFAKSPPPLIESLIEDAARNGHTDMVELLRSIHLKYLEKDTGDGL